MKWTSCIALGAAFAALLASALPAMADLKIGISAEPYPPFASQDAAGTWVGWEIDFAEALCAEVKEKCEIVATAWDSIIPALTSKQIDVIVASMLITQERKEAIDFTRFYYDTPPAIIGAKNGDKDISPAHMKGKMLGVQAATGHELYATRYLVPPGVGLKTYLTLDEANTDLAAARLDYVLASSPALYDFLGTDQGKQCCELKSIVEKPADDTGIYGEGVGAGVRKEDTALKDKLNAAIAAMAKAGEFEEITKNYPHLVGKITLPSGE
ncbi:MAG: transporter substrate-binding domain-containing protein [Aestuariivirga sp.]|uniref:transporter substrate-binding domain-containing protein n=1 Tax=Aestuariivirga sp. TaxID=2650926 RepID=UPI0025BEE840|nr:transporter substrate-binding domain-containing protein [Aestuariivirga sp.]MCA3562022.1 transporter substrate-binding domain-containing protein [Aestuariivirga sp.]